MKIALIISRRPVPAAIELRERYNLKKTFAADLLQVQ
jgi:hypothetical protein